MLSCSKKTTKLRTSIRKEDIQRPVCWGGIFQQISQRGDAKSIQSLDLIRSKKVLNVPETPCNLLKIHGKSLEPPHPAHTLVLGRKSWEIEYFQYKIYILKPGAEFLFLQKPTLPPISIDQDWKDQPETKQQTITPLKTPLNPLNTLKNPWTFKTTLKPL